MTWLKDGRHWNALHRHEACRTLFMPAQAFPCRYRHDLPFGGIMTSLHSRTIAEHLCRLSTILESEALRSGALGIASSDKLYREALELRELAEAFWEHNASIALPELPQSCAPSPASARLRRHPVFSVSSENRGNAKPDGDAMAWRLRFP